MILAHTKPEQPSKVKCALRLSAQLSASPVDGVGARVRSNGIDLTMECRTREFERSPLCKLSAV